MWATLLVIVVIGGALRIHRVGGESPWFDEIVTVRHLPATSLGAYFEGVFTDDPRSQMAPVYHLVQYGWSRMFGNSILAIRWLSLLLGIACIPMMFLVGRTMFGGAGVGLLGAAAFAVSLINVYYAQEMRYYALLSVLALASMGAFVRVVREGDWRWWTLHLISNVLLMGTHSFSPLLFAAQGGFVLLFRWKDRALLLGWLGGHIAILVGLGVAMLFMRYDVGTQGLVFNDMPPYLREFANTVLVFMGGRFDNQEPAMYMPNGVSLDRHIGLLWLLLTIFLMWTVYGRKVVASGTDKALPGDATSARQRDREAIALCLLWFLVPLVLLYLASHTWRPVFYRRYVLYSSFPVCLLLGAGVARLRAGWCRGAVAAALLIAYGYQTLALPRPFRADYVSAARAIEADSEAHVHALKSFNSLGISFALGEPEGTVRTFEGFRELCADTVETVQGGVTVWVVFYRWSRDKDFEERMASAGLVAHRTVFSGMPPLVTYRVSTIP